MQSFLSYLSKYIQLSPEEEAILLSKFKHRKYLKGQYIVQNGDVARYQTYIISGKVRTFCLDDKGHENIILFGIENWWVGDLESFIRQSPADFNTQCLENSEVMQIRFEDLEQLYKEVPKMERFFRLIFQSAYANMSKRVVRSYSLPAKERYLLFCEEYPQIAKRVPQYMIASYLGITKEFLSAIRKQIADEAKS
ncbi:MAG: Crp/Fnr family transcriptional regulator [Saprospiraceae bacterium]